MMGLEATATVSRFPFGYPKGWFQVLWSDELGPQQIISRSYFGRNVIIWRDASGVPVVSDAFCPHMGAHLAVGGEVNAKGLRCPFHGWTFASDGSVVEIPYSANGVGKAGIRTMPTVERHGQILAWNAERGGSPEWPPPEVPEYGTEEWGEYFSRATIQIKSCCQELQENITDVNHVPILHKLSHIESMSVEARGPRRSIDIIEAVESPMGTSRTQAHITCLGLGYVIVRFTSAVEIASVSSVTPVDLETVEVRFSWLIRRPPGRPRLRRVGQAIADETIRILREDAEIWEHKVYLHRPRLLPEDEPVRDFRVWASQFYK